MLVGDHYNKIIIKATEVSKNTQIEIIESSLTHRVEFPYSKERQIETTIVKTLQDPEVKEAPVYQTIKVKSLVSHQTSACLISTLYQLPRTKSNRSRKWV